MASRAFIVRVARTAGGKRNGRISHIHPAALGAVSVDAALARVGEFDYGLVDDVIFGCVSQVTSSSPCHHAYLRSRPYHSTTTHICGARVVHLLVPARIGWGPRGQHRP